MSIPTRNLHALLKDGALSLYVKRNLADLDNNLCLPGSTPVIDCARTFVSLQLHKFLDDTGLSGFDNPRDLVGKVISLEQSEALFIY